MNSLSTRALARPLPPPARRAAPAPRRAAPAPRRTAPPSPPPLRAVRADQAADTVDAATLDAIASVTAAADGAHAAALTAAAADAAAAAALPPRASALRAKVLASVRDLQKGLLERETEVRLLLLAALAGEHLLLLGPPGTAKSELSRRLAALTGGKYFERLLTRFSVPEELFGPLSMKGLENDLYVRQVEGYLPTAEVAFIDEIFKANSAILNALLTLLNERLFDNGSSRGAVPLLCLVGASNELPESEELDALFDRFLIRRQVAQVSASNLGRLADLAAGQAGTAAATAAGAADDDAAAAAAAAAAAGAGAGLDDLTMTDFQDAAGDAHAAVRVPPSVIDLLVGLRTFLQDKCEPPVYVSDRRFMKAVALLQVAAHADGRDEVSEVDCLLLEHVFGQRPDDAHKVRARVLDVIGSDPGLTQAELVLLALFGRAARVLGGGGADAGDDAAGAKADADALVDLLRLRHAALASTLDGGFADLKATVWLSAPAARAAAQALAPPLEEARAKASDLLREAMLVSECLGAGKPGVLERVLPKRAKQYAKGVAERA